MAPDLRTSIARPQALRHLLVITRQHYRLALYRRRPLTTRFKRLRTYEIAIGAIGYETPAGVFVMTRKSDAPDWTAPDSEWVPVEIRGRTFAASDPANPIKGAYLDVWNGVGVHGTAALDSLGTQASHGCIRMREDEVLELFRLVPVGTPVVVI